MKRNGKKSRKIKKLIIACTLSAVVLIVSTYTWFIGMQTVKVDPFEINIATTEGLFLSMDGKTWVYNLDVMEATPYAKNTNLMPSETNKLEPISSVGALDGSVSRMRLYEKSSLTTTPGGYRLLSKRIDNNTTGTDGKLKQGSGYVVFDLFIKNLSGNAYYTENELKNEEAIYLTDGSTVSVSTVGAEKQDKTGIENSIRIAFAQIGRVSATTTSVDTITELTCNIDTKEGSATKGKPIYTSTNGVTGICREAQIWEPNDTKHVNNAINWFEKSCLQRNNATAENATLGQDVTKTESYKVATESVAATYCDFPGDTTTIDTYAINDEIEIGDNVDVYDGHNGYTAISSKLTKMDYFTDSEKVKNGTERPQFMSLAPNSITKVRVYIWLEGQDLDNYDFAQLGKKVQINFGFTKERFDTSDIPGYNGPAPVTSDNADILTPETNG